MRYSEIDREFPVSGQDNESQGFRDNFDAIQESLQYCDTEITDLKETTVKLGVENVFNDNATLNGVKLVNVSEEVFRTASAINSNHEINYTLGSYQYLKIKNNITLSLTGWPTAGAEEGGRFTKLRLELIRDPSSQTDNNLSAVTVTFASSDSAIKYDDAWPSTLTLTSTTDPIIIEFWTWDKSSGIYARILGQYGAGNGTKTVNNLAVNGNTVLGNDVLTDRITMSGIPKLPFITTAQRDLIVPEEGMIIYNISQGVNKVQAYVGGAAPGWVDLH